MTTESRPRVLAEDSLRTYLRIVFRTFMGFGPSKLVSAIRPGQPRWSAVLIAAGGGRHQLAVFWLMPPLRQASADEIAADILNDPALREALGFLASGEGHVIEDAAM